MEFDPPSVIHHYSWTTRVSLELPPDWVEVDTGERYAIYGAVAPDGEEPEGEMRPKFVVKVADGLLADPQAYLELGRQMAEQPMEGGEHVDHQEFTVDEFDAVMDVVRYHEPSVDHRMSQVQVFVQVGQLVFSFSGLSGAEEEEVQRRVFEAAVASVRFVLPGAGVEP